MRAALRRIAAFTVVSAVVYGAVMAAVATFAPPDPATQLSYAPVGVGAGGLVAYYLVYMDGYRTLRERYG